MKQVVDLCLKAAAAEEDRFVFRHKTYQFNGQQKKTIVLMLRQP